MTKYTKEDIKKSDNDAKRFPRKSYMEMGEYDEDDEY